MRWVLLILTMAVANSVISSIVWRVVGAKRRPIRLIGRTLGLVFGLVNFLVAAVAFVQLWRIGWDWFCVVMFLLGLIFAFRFGGAISGRYP